MLQTLELSMNVKQALVPFLFIFLYAVPVLAQEEDDFEEPIKEFNFTESVYNQGKNEFQFTLLGRHFERDGLNSYTFKYEVEYGLTDQLQLEASVLDRRIRPRDTELERQSFFFLEAGLLYNLYSSRKFAATASLVAEFPLNSKKEFVIEEEDIHVTSYTPHLVLATQLGRGQLHLDMGAEFAAGEREYFTNLAAVYPLGDFRALLELNGGYDEEVSLFLSPGLGWRVVESLDLLTGVAIGLDSKEKPWGLNVGIIYEFSAGN